LLEPPLVDAERGRLWSGLHGAPLGVERVLQACSTGGRIYAQSPVRVIYDQWAAARRIVG
jgi:hypothetical protein